MQALRGERKNRTDFIGVVTDCNDRVPHIPQKRLGAFGGVAGDVDAHFLHDANGQRVHAGGLQPALALSYSLPAIDRNYPSAI